jgi:hypothetical protein
MTQPNQPTHQDPLQQASGFLSRGEYRMAELMLNDLARKGDNRSGVHINLALIALYQYRWWEGAYRIYLALSSAPQSERDRIEAAVRNGLENQAGKWQQQGLIGDAADLRRIAAAFRPWPEGPVAFAARWLPDMTTGNRPEALMRFAEWCRLSKFSDPLRQEDLARLFAAAFAASEGYLPPMLVEGLMLHVANLPAPPPVWAEALIKALASDSQIQPFLGIPLHEQLSNHGDVNLHTRLGTFLANTLLVGNNPYKPSGLSAWRALGETLLPLRYSVRWDAHYASRHYGAYDIDTADALWRQVNLDAMEPQWFEGWDPETLFATFGKLAFLASRRDPRLATKKKLEDFFSPLLQRYYRSQLDELGLQPINARIREPLEGRPLRVGYLTRYAYRHSMAYLLEVMLSHHSDAVDTFLYDVALRPGSDDLARSLRSKVKKYRHMPVTDVRMGHAAAAGIAADGIDLLVDVDGVTNAYNSLVHLFRPAPASCILAGADSMGDPNVDYFLADPYCLDENAQDCYVERISRTEGCIWISEGYRHNTGQETRAALRRELGVAEDTVLYLVAGPGSKITREQAEDAMHVLAAVPDSALLVKGKGNLALMQRFWFGQAGAAGIDPGRIHVLPFAPSQEAHRAQLRAADVFLDTYPYTGGSHTLEVLWLGIPPVTLYGETSYSRMSRSMLSNLGITETTASTREQYQAIAVRLGTDRAWRRELEERLLDAAADRTGLWNTRQQVDQLEDVYRVMVGSKSKGPMV